MTSIEKSMEEKVDIMTTQSTSTEIETYKRKNEADDEKCDYYFCTCTSNYCQYFVDVQWAVFSNSLAILTQSMFVSGFLTGSLTTIERRYELSSREIGIFSVMYDLGQLTFLLPVAIAGSGQRRKMRIESVGLFVMGLAALMFAAPHLLSVTYNPQEPYLPICNGTVRAQVQLCGAEDVVRRLRRFRWLFWAACFLFGVGASPIYSLGTAYVDENSEQDKGYFYFALMNSNIFFGAAIGNILIGVFLEYYIDIKTPANLHISSKDRSVWLGAWWIGPLVTSAACLITVVPLFGLPKRMPRALRLRRNKDRLEIAEGQQLNLLGIAKSLHHVVTNVIVLMLSISISCELMFFTGLTVFGPKYMETTFGVQRSRAPQIIGVATVAAGASGMLLGGIITRKGNFDLAANLRMVVFLSLVNLFPLIAFLIHCPEHTSLELGRKPCNADCNCHTLPRLTLHGCGADHRNYFSPCFAGCRIGNMSGFFDCRCIVNGSSTVPEWRNEFCPLRCTNRMASFVFILCVEVFITCLMGSPAINATLRCVEEGLQSIALGLVGVFSRLLGSIPGPLIFAVLIDRACASWRIECGTRGFCQDYDRRYLRLSFLVATLVCKCTSALAVCTALLYYRWRTKIGSKRAISHSENT